MAWKIPNDFLMQLQTVIRLSSQNDVYISSGWLCFYLFRQWQETIRSSISKEEKTNCDDQKWQHFEQKHFILTLAFTLLCKV